MVYGIYQFVCTRCAGCRSVRACVRECVGVHVLRAHVLDAPDESVQASSGRMKK